MSTRSLTRVHSGDLDSPILVSIYQQSDGYFEGVGEDLKEFLNGFTIVNGISIDIPRKSANGMECLAAQLVSHLKHGIGGTYITTPGNIQEYNYDIFIKNNRLRLIGVSEDGNETKKFKFKSTVNAT